MKDEGHLPDLKHAFQRYDKLRKQMGISPPNEIIWHSAGLERNYDAIADGLGGATAIVWEGSPIDCFCHYNHKFDTEEAAVEAIKIKAKADGVWEDEHDEVRAVSEADET